MTRPSDDDIKASVADDLPVGLWVARAPGGEEVYANKMFAEIMGTGARDVALGEYSQPYGIHDRAGVPYPEQRLPFVRALAERRTVVVDDIAIHRPDGGKVFVRAQAKPVFDGDDITHVVIAFIDITREVQAEEARAESEARLRRAQRMESIGQLAGGIAHDFNNMLAVIKGLAGLLLKDERDVDRRADLVTIDDVTNKAVQLTRSLLGFSGRARKRSTAVRVDEVVASLAPMLQRTLDRRITLQVDLLAARNVVGDFSMLEQVVMNLVMNSRDALSDGGTITIRTRDVDDRVVLEVLDDGSGIPLVIRERVFEPYFTTKGTGAHKGTGLGLATVYGIVESHGGTIEIRDVVPRGNCMRVSLPAAPPDTELLPRVAAGVLVEPVHGKGVVLLVEDDELVRSASERTIRSLGFDVITAAHGAEALRIARAEREHIDAVVLDLMMPHMDGRATLLGLRAIDRALPVLVTSGFAWNEEIQAMMNLGADAFVEKPWQLDVFAEKLARLVQARHPQESS